jgi:DNA transformation protein
MSEREDRLEDLPNIGPVLAQRLSAAGITTAAAFRAAGDEQVFARLVAAFPEEACTHTRLALAGAARGVRWHALPQELRRALTQGLSR